ncbi:hypothetical protein ZIOFF_067914 [Zingiber officinale]|uniref:DNA-directed RNA polymerase subunit n=2 Tax=Zingiber officinale TaxID=94328 RepID=A0A8J5CEL6_ZINOF|nr:hypothetical protein ZIOFF_067914 [Zingiber officinale]
MMTVSLEASPQRRLLPLPPGYELSWWIRREILFVAPSSASLEQEHQCRRQQSFPSRNRHLVLPLPTVILLARTSPVRPGRMFYLSLIEHNLRLPPHLLNRPLVDAIKDELERLYLDKVITNLGLCISVYDIRSLEGGFIYPGEGSSTYKVVFRLLIFRPFIGEVICAKLKASDATGLHLTLGFFSDIHVPVHLLPKESEMGEDGIWVWKHEFGDLAMDLDEEVNVRVTKINYPSIPVEQDANAQPFAPMQIIGEIYGDGLGLISWWAD